MIFNYIQTSSRILSAFLSLFMRMETVEYTSINSTIPAQRIGTIGIVKGYHPLTANYEKNNGILVRSYSKTGQTSLSKIDFKTAGLNYRKIKIYTLGAGIFIFTAAALGSIGAIVSNASGV